MKIPYFSSRQTWYSLAKSSQKNKIKTLEGQGPVWRGVMKEDPISLNLGLRTPQTRPVRVVSFLTRTRGTQQQKMGRAKESWDYETHLLLLSPQEERLLLFLVPSALISSQLPQNIIFHTLPMLKWRFLITMYQFLKWRSIPMAMTESPLRWNRPLLTVALRCIIKEK